MRKGGRRPLPQVWKTTFEKRKKRKTADNDEHCCWNPIRQNNLIVSKTRRCSFFFFNLTYAKLKFVDFFLPLRYELVISVAYYEKGGSRVTWPNISGVIWCASLLVCETTFQFSLSPSSRHATCATGSHRPIQPHDTLSLNRKSYTMGRFLFIFFIHFTKGEGWGIFMRRISSK